MKLTPLLVLLVSVMLVGCRDGSSKDDTEAEIGAEIVIGTLPIPNIEGLTYETASQSGVLDASQFKYLEGESVSIKLGDQILITLDTGSAISLDTFINEWPATENEMETAFFEDESFQSFQQTANFMQLIHNLDADNNSENGFDLLAYSEISEKIDIDLNINPYEFYETTLLTLARILDSQRAITPMVSIGTLFLMANKNIELEQRISYTTDSDNDGSIDETTEYEYDEIGFELNRQTDGNADQVTDETYTYTYNSQGLVTSEFRADDRDYDGIIDSIYGTDYGYNQLSLVSLKTFISDNDGDGLNMYSTQTAFSYDSEGRKINETIKEDQDGDTVYESRDSTDYTYDESGNVSRKILNKDDNFDGTIDDTYTYTFSYRDTGELLLETRSEDLGADGTEDGSRTEAYEYNEQNLETSKTLKDFDEDGVLGFNQMEARTYNDDGNQISYFNTLDYTGDGDADTKTTSERTYDSVGNLIESITLNYSDGTNLSGRTRYTYENDEQGYASLYRREKDNDLDGDYDETYETVYINTESGNAITRISTQDDESDGTLESTSVLTYLYDQNLEGVKALLQQFGDY